MVPHNEWALPESANAPADDPAPAASVPDEPSAKEASTRYCRRLMLGASFGRRRCATVK